MLLQVINNLISNSTNNIFIELSTVSQDKINRPDKKEKTGVFRAKSFFATARCAKKQNAFSYSMSGYYSL